MTAGNKEKQSRGPRSPVTGRSLFVGYIPTCRYFKASMESERGEEKKQEDSLPSSLGETETSDYFLGSFSSLDGLVQQEKRAPLSTFHASLSRSYEQDYSVDSTQEAVKRNDLNCDESMPTRVKSVHRQSLIPNPGLGLGRLSAGRLSSGRLSAGHPSSGRLSAGHPSSGRLHAGSAGCPVPDVSSSNGKCPFLASTSDKNAHTPPNPVVVHKNLELYRSFSCDVGGRPVTDASDRGSHTSGSRGKCPFFSDGSDSSTSAQQTRHPDESQLDRTYHAPRSLPPDMEALSIRRASCPASHKFQGGECPFFTGASDANAALMQATAEKSPGSLSNVYTLEKSGSGRVVNIDYSYTRPNPEFPSQLREDDLFGHPTQEGFMTREYGFMVPDYEHGLATLLQAKGRIWYNMGQRMRALMGNNGLMKAVEEMEIVPGDERSCPVDSLQIASSILAHLINGYRAACARNHVVYKAAPALQIPFTMISRRLGRKDIYVAPEDLMYNQRPIRGNVFRFDNIEMISPIWGTSAEALMSKLFCESNRHLRNMMGAILALCRGEWKCTHICTMISEIKELTYMLGKAIPDDSAKSSIDPVEFATAFANATSPLKQGVPALSGAGCPIFVCMDLIIGRKKWSSVMGADLLLQIKWMPKNWRRFIEYLRQQRLFEKVPADMQYLWKLLKDAYCGERGWLGKHKYRAYQFVELAGALGRSSNKGSASGAGTIHMLEESRRERDPTITDDRSSYKMCLFKGKIKAVTRESDDRITKLVTIESSRALSIHIGDHIAIVMKNNDDTIWTFSSHHRLQLDDTLSTSDGTLNQEWKERLDFDSLPYNVYNVLMCAKLTSSVDNLTLENICELLHPEEPRLYSFATVHPTRGCVTSFDLLVTRTGIGGCSDFLHKSVGSEVSFGISTAINMHIPKIITRPLVVIAAGSGLGTYLPLIANDRISNHKYAFLAFRTENTVPYLNSHLKQAVNYGKLEMFVELSREDVTLVTVDRSLKRIPTSKRYIDKLLEEEAELIRELAAPLDEGGLEASFYICGNNEFFRTVRTALDQIAQGMVASLVSSNRLNLEVQARGGIDGQVDTRPIKLTETCFHNKMDDYWTIIDGKVYDFSEYLAWHPGGRKILHYVAGTDCSEFWHLVCHSRDRMVYSQISAYLVGQFDSSDPDGLMKFLEFVTRCENCVNLYQAKKDLFKNLCDSYGKVQNLWESVFGNEFFRLLMKLVKCKKTVCRMFERVWIVKHGVARNVANRMFSVAPIVKGLDPEKSRKVPGIFKVANRPASHQEMVGLESRLISSSSHFFVRCKKAIVDASEALQNASTRDAEQTVYKKLFFRLVTILEELYSSLSQPMPVANLRCWDLLRAEIQVRKTFRLRFATSPVIVPESHKDLVLRGPPLAETMEEAYFDEIQNFLEVDMTNEYRMESSMASSIIKEWLRNKELQGFFERLDADGDGLVSREDILHAAPKNEIEETMLHALKAKLEVYVDIETFNFEEFLLCHPDLAKKRAAMRSSYLLFAAEM